MKIHINLPFSVLASKLKIYFGVSFLRYGPNLLVILQNNCK